MQHRIPHQEIISSLSGSRPTLDFLDHVMVSQARRMVWISTGVGGVSWLIIVLTFWTALLGSSPPASVGQTGRGGVLGEVFLEGDDADRSIGCEVAAALVAAEDPAR